MKNKLATGLAIMTFGASCGAFCVAVLREDVPHAIFFTLAIIGSICAVSLFVRSQIKWLAALMVLICCPALSRAQAATTNLIALTWDILPQYQSNEVFYVVSTTNVALAVTNWPVYTNITMQQFLAAGTNVPIASATEQAMSFSFASSNVTGRSDFAVPATVWRAMAGSGLRIIKR